MYIMKKHRGLGDTVEAITKATGIKAVVDAGAKVLKKTVGVAIEKIN